MPTFSVIIPTYNRASMLGKALESVLGQTCDDFELIVVDDGSTDNTGKIVARYNDPKIKYIKQKNCGVSSARNRGINEACGEWICLLDSDDSWRKNKLEIANRHIEENPEYKIFHTDEVWYRDGKILNQKKKHQRPHGFVFENAVKLCCLGTSTIVIHKSVFNEVGLFDEDFPACEDYDLWLRITSEMPVFLIPEPLTIKQGGHDDQLSKKHPVMDKFRIEALKKILESNKLDKDNYKIAFEELKYKVQIVINGAIKRGRSDDVDYYNNTISKLETNE